MMNNAYRLVYNYVLKNPETNTNSWLKSQIIKKAASYELNLSPRFNSVYSL